jgi:hypothetical protein
VNHIPPVTFKLMDQLLSILDSFFGRLGQEEPDEKSDDSNGRGHKARGLGDVGRKERPIAREHRCDEVGGDKGHAGTEHSTPDVGGEAAARTAQVEGKSFGQILAKVAELRNREQTANEITPQENLTPLPEQREISQRQNDQGRHLEDSQQGHTSHAQNQQHREQNPAQ